VTRRTERDCISRSGIAALLASGQTPPPTLDLYSRKVVGFEVHGTDTGSIISDQRSALGMEEPIKGWTPVISPSGMAFYDGHAFPG
jgi:Glucose / Sorbosone dehydrogenase